MKKTSRKRKATPDSERGVDKRSATEKFRATAHPSLERRAVWLQYSPGAKIVRVNVEETLEDKNELTGVRILRGHDVDIPIGELDGQILSALEDALSWLAEDVGAEVYVPPEPEET